MADETQVTELIIDASQAVQGAAQFSDAADQIGVASQDAATKTDALGQQVETTTETVVTSARELRKQAQALDTYRAATDETYSAQKQLGSISTQLQSAEAALTREMQNGAISVEKYQAELAALKSRQSEISDTSAKLEAGQIAVKDAMKVVAGQSEVVTRGWGLNRTGMMEMQAAGVNAFQALASGMSPWRVAQMEGAQVLGALVQGTQGLLQYALNPYVLAMGAATIATAALIVSLRSLRMEQTTYQVAIQATGNANRISVDQLHAMTLELKSAGVSASDAQSAIVGAMHAVAGASAADLQRATKDAADFAAAYGKPIADAEKSLVELATGGATAILKLDQSINFLTPAQAEMVRQLGLQGKGADAASIAFQALEGRIAGANDKINEQSGLLGGLKSAWQSFVDFMANGATWADADTRLHFLAQRVQSLRDALDMGGSADRKAGLEKQIHELSAPMYNSGTAFSGSFSDFTSAIGAPSPAESASSKYLNQQIELYQQLTPALQANASARALVQARIAAETEAMEHNLSPADRESLISLRIAEAKAKMGQAANDNARAIELETVGTLKVAAAYAQGADAIIAAQAAMQADAIASQNATVNKAKLTQELIKQKEAQLQLQAAQELANSKLKTANDLEALRISQIGDPQVKHDEELKAQRQAYLNELTAKYGENIAMVNDLMGQFDKQQLIEDQTRYWNEVYSTAKTYSDDITNYLVDGLTGVGNSGKSMWANMWDTAMAGAKRFLVKLAATFLENTLIIPIVTQIVGSNSSLLGIVSASGTGSSLGGLGSLLSGGSSGILSTLSSAYNLLNTGGSSLLSGLGSDLIYSSLGQSLGLSTSVVNMSHLATAGGLQMTGAGSLLSSGLGLLGAGGTGFGIGSIISGLGIGNSTGSSIGGALGGAIGSIIPGVGTIIGSVAGSLLGGLFGNSQPSDMFANTGIDLTKGTIGSVEHGRADETSSTNNSASQNLANSFLTIEKQLVALTGGTAPSSAFAKVGSRDGIVVGVGDGATFWNNQGVRKTFANTDAGAQQAIDWMVQQLAKQLKGVTNQDIQTVLNKGGTADQIISNLTLVQSLLTATATAADPLATAVQSVNDSFDALKKQATDLGLSTDLLTKLEAKRQEQLSEATAAYSLTGYQAVQGSLSTITGFLGSQQLSSDSSLSPLAKQAAAAKQYNDLLAAVQGGDLTQTNALTGAASSYLSVARQNYGSTAGFSSVEAYVTQSLAALGQSIASQQSIGDQITKAIQLSTVTNAQKLDEVKASIEKMTTQLRLMMPQIAAAAA